MARCGDICDTLSVQILLDRLGTNKDVDEVNENQGTCFVNKTSPDEIWKQSIPEASWWVWRHVDLAILLHRMQMQVEVF